MIFTDNLVGVLVAVEHDRLQEGLIDEDVVVRLQNLESGARLLAWVRISVLTLAIFNVNGYSHSYHGFK